MTFVSKENPAAQISIFRNKKKLLDNAAIFISIEVSNVDALYEQAKKLNIEIVYPVTNEPWGVRRFFVKDPNGAAPNLLAHRND